MTGLTYDTGALLGAERTDRALWALHRAALARGARPTVPAPVLAQAWRGGPQAQLSRLLRGCVVEAMAEDAARSAGRACALSGARDVVDAAVVVSAAARGDAVVTSDPGDLARIADAIDARVVLHAL